MNEEKKGSVYSSQIKKSEYQEGGGDGVNQRSSHHMKLTSKDPFKKSSFLNIIAET